MALKGNVNHYITVKYQIFSLIENSNEEYEDTGILEIKVSPYIRFDNLIKKLIKNNNFKYMVPFIDDLPDHTWGKIFSMRLLHSVEIEIKEYIMPKYTILEMQNMFNFFDNILMIKNDHGGYGETYHFEEGIRFIIHSNEKDRHRYEPHVHCEYGGEEYRFRIDTLDIMKGDKPFKNKRKNKVVFNWIKNNQEELLNYYNKFAIGEIYNIDFVARK